MKLNNNKKLKFKIRAKKKYQEGRSNLQHSSQNYIWEYILTKHNDEVATSSLSFLFYFILLKKQAHTRKEENNSNTMVHYKLYSNLLVLRECEVSYTLHNTLS